MPAKTLIRRDPFDLFTPFFEFGRRWQDLAGNSDEQGPMIVPPVDVAETEDHLTLAAELPGLRKEDVKITIEDGVLSVSGEKKYASQDDRKDFLRVERRYGTFHRSFTLPTQVDASGVKAAFEDGVLVIRVPKSEAAKPRTVEID